MRRRLGSKARLQPRAAHSSSNSPWAARPAGRLMARVCRGETHGRPLAGSRASLAALPGRTAGISQPHIVHSGSMAVVGRAIASLARRHGGRSLGVAAARTVTTSVSRRGRAGDLGCWLNCTRKSPFFYLACDRPIRRRPCRPRLRLPMRSRRASLPVPDSATATPTRLGLLGGLRAPSRAPRSA